jgi:hypothetical protein
MPAGSPSGDGQMKEVVDFIARLAFIALVVACLVVTYLTVTGR